MEWKFLMIIVRVVEKYLYEIQFVKMLLLK